MEAATLLVVGSADHPVVELNGNAFQRLRCEKRIEVVVGATHLFEEPGALEEVASLARAWFVDPLMNAPRPRGLLPTDAASP